MIDEIEEALLAMREFIDASQRGQEPDTGWMLAKIDRALELRKLEKGLRG